MSRSSIVKRRRKVRYKSGVTPYGKSLNVRVIPCNPLKGAEDVPYEGMPCIELAMGEDRTISNRSGDRKKL